MTNRPPRRSPGLVGCLLALTFCLLLGSTGLATLYIGTAPSTADPSGNDAAVMQIVTRFYDAVNETMQSGNADALTRLVAPEFVGIDGQGGPPEGRTVLLASLANLRMMVPGMRLAPDAVWASTESGTVTVHLEIAGTGSGAFLGLALPSDLASWGWGPLERLRISDGLVVERWSNATAAAIQSAGQTMLLQTDPHAPCVVALLRLTVAPHTGIDMANGLATRVLVGESGMGTVTTNHSARPTFAPIRSGLPLPAASPMTDDPPIQLTVGDQILTVPGQTYAVSNAGDTPLSILIAMRLRMSGSDHSPETLAAMVRGAPSVGPGDEQPGLTEDVLAVAMTPAATTFTLGRIVLAPGATLTWPQADRPILLAVDGGQLAVMAIKPEAAATPADGRIWIGDEPLFQVGDGTLIMEHTATVWHGMGGAPTVVLVLAIGS